MRIPSMNEAYHKATLLKQLAGLILLIIFCISGVYANDENKTKQYEYLKKAKYFEIRAELEAGEITLEEAQKMWQKELNKLKKREGK